MTGTCWLRSGGPGSRGASGAELDRALAALAPGGASSATCGIVGAIGAAGSGDAQLGHLDGVHVASWSDLLEREALARRLDVDPALPDPLLVAAAWHEWGDDIGRHLAGDFALTIVDERRGTVVALRDLGGARPLLHWSDGDGVAGIATAPAAALATSGLARRLDAEAAVRHLFVLTLPAESTFVRDLRRLPPGHQLRWTPGRTAVVERFAWWEPTRDQHREPDAWAEALGDAVVQAVQARVPPSGPVGVHVSGGLDSTAIAAIVAAEAPDRVRAVSFSSAPDATIGGEAPNDADLLRATGLRIVHHPRRSATGRRAAPGMLPPAYDATTMHEWAASEGIATMLSGWGGDEAASFNGRDAIATLLSAGRLPTALRAWRAVRPHVAARRTYVRERVLEPLLPDGALWALRRARGQAEVHRIANSVVVDQVAIAHGVDDAHRHPLRARAGHGRTQRLLLDDPHVADRTDGWAIDAARFGVTYAHPLLDPRVVGIALAAPPELSLHDGWDRWLFRRALEPHLPGSIVWRRSKADSWIQAAHLHRLRASVADLIAGWDRLRALAHDGDDLGGLLDLAILSRSLDMLEGAAWRDLPPKERRRLLGLQRLHSLLELIDADELVP